ncbi:hypothetical protein, partial [Nitrincola nitratireducens]|uniref:hypothetical protein n=1 Tax=Nitrincola nitratireducens TaxID=1229521 RepID=UPI00055C2118
MKINQKYDHPIESTGVTRPRWVENPNPEFEPLWVMVKNILIFFLAVHAMVLFGNFFLEVMHPLTIVNIAMTMIVPIVVISTAFLQSRKPEPDDLYLSNLGTLALRIFVYLGANVALILSISFGVFPIIFSALLIACIVIELLSYLTYRSYSDDMIREIIEERKMLSPVNENNEFWFLTRGGDVGS